MESSKLEKRKAEMHHHHHVQQSVTCGAYGEAPPSKKARTSTSSPPSTSSLSSSSAAQMTADEGTTTTTTSMLELGKQQTAPSNGTDATSSGSGGSNPDNPLAGLPNENALRELIRRTGYVITQENGQRKYGGPPPDWHGRPVPRGAEVFVGKIPRDVFEDELVPVFERAGRIYELRLMMDFDGKNRGYAFVMFGSKHEAKQAVLRLNNFEIRKGRTLGVCHSVDNCRLFVGGIPKSKKKEDIMAEMAKVTEGVCEVIVYPSASDKTKNRGFAFVEYETHRAAAMARRKLIPGRIQLWGHPIAVDWAEPEQEVDEDIMEQVKVLYVRNLMLDTTEDTLQSLFSQFSPGSVERVKKIRDYAFVHFTTREACVEAMAKLNGARIDGAEVEVTLAKPVDKNDHNRMAKVGAKVLAQGVTGSADVTALPAQAMVANPNPAAAAATGGLILYPNGMIGTTGPEHLAYYQTNHVTGLATATAAAAARTIPGTAAVAGGKNARQERARGGAGRNSYLGYSAGKATYGRYYAKNNQDRAVETGFDPAQSLAQMLPVGDLSALYKTSGGGPQYGALQQIVPLVQQPQPPAKAPEQLLEEVCARNMWGSPSYQLMTVPAGVGDGRQFFFYKVKVPAVASLNPHMPSFQPNKLAMTIEEAKSFAAEYVLAQLNIQPAAADPSPQIMVPMVQQQAAPPYQGYIAQAATLQMRGQGGPHQAASLLPAVTTASPTAAYPMTFVDPASAAVMQPITVMYQ